MPNLLVTGGAGFIGSHFILHCHQRYPEYHIVNLDKLTYAADTRYLTSIADSDRYHFIQGDIADSALVHDIFEQYQPIGVVHFAAESHVDNSIKNPNAFVQTNVLGTQVLLEAARQHWQTSHRFLHVSTDEVYGALGETGLFTELSPLQPSSPYSASKAGSDLLVQSYHHTYNMNTVISRCTNNFGPHQHAEKFIPTVIRNALRHQSIPIYGSGLNKRDWIYVGDHCQAIDTLFHHGQSGEIYNVGANCEMRNLELAKMICQLLARPESLITMVSDRPGHDFRYALDASKINTATGWRASSDFEVALKQTIDWYARQYAAVGEYA